MDAAFSPDTGSSVEAHEASGEISSDVLDDEVPIEHHGLDSGEQGGVALDVPPAGRWRVVKQRPSYRL